jgi:transcriptional regulator with XRE-family HTH domain
VSTNPEAIIARAVGARIREARLAVGLTQRELADRLGARDALAVSRWERGVNVPNERMLLGLARVLEREVAWFYGGVEQAA